jgi:hypothetical protein
LVLVTGGNDPASSEPVERNPLDQLVEIRISVRVPGELLPDGEDSFVSHYTVLNPEQIQMPDLYKNLPPVLERINNLLCLALALP